MRHEAGTRLGPYEIIGPLGAGGMGEVFRARDARLGRDVAIKVLAPGLARDEAAMARFEREARAVAALSHPNILAIFDVGRDGDTSFVVTELLEGQTLRERLATGPVPARKALDYARAVADALAAAHERGIVHRDVKPDNVFVTTDGRVKVLDFGLAQMQGPASAPTDATFVHTAASATTPGLALGTIGYMAPEQVRGLSVDHRADIFSLGALLLELVTGRRAFGAASAADTMSAILNSDPADLPAIGTLASPGVERVVRRCLEKAPAERFQSARDLSFALEALSGSSTTSNPATPVASTPARPATPSWALPALAVVALIAAAAAFTAGRRMQPPTSTPPTGRFTILANRQFRPVGGDITVSPDGRYVAYRDATERRAPRLSIRRLDVMEPRQIDVGPNADVFWSPDSRQIGVINQGVLSSLEVPDGTPRRIAELGTAEFYGGTWGSKGLIVVATEKGLFSVPASGGAPRLFSPTVAAKGEKWRGGPSFLPDGQHLLYQVGVGIDEIQTRVATADGTDDRQLATGLLGASYANGHVFYGMNGALFARPFDAGALQFSGEPIEISRSAVQDARNGWVAAAASDNGVIAFRPAPPGQTDVRFDWVDRKGVHVASVPVTDAFTNFDVSPDSQQIATTRKDPATGANVLWLIDTRRGTATLAAPEPKPEGYGDPTWAPDGRTLAYRHANTLVMRLANGGPERVIRGAAGYPDSFTRDGRFLIYGEAKGTVYEEFAIDVTTPNAQPIPLVTGHSMADEGRFSPNGKWVAYHSNESGGPDVFVIPFPPTGERWQISTKPGGVQPRWSTDGNELFYLDLDGRLMAVKMPTSDPTRAEAPSALFATGLIPSTSLDQFAVSGERFLLRIPSAPATTNSPIEVVVNWAGARRK